METASPLPRSELIRHLVDTRIAGNIATTRENNLDHYRSLALGDPYYMFGLTFRNDWTYRDVLALMAKSAGVVDDPEHRAGQDTIDPERTVDALDAMAARIAAALKRPNPRLLFATGHPTGIMTIHLALARLAARCGATLLTPAEGTMISSGGLGRKRRILYFDDVCVLADGGALVHSHDPAPMQRMLARLDSEPPDLVVADHGFAGAAGEAGVETVGFADSNDPGLFVGEAEGKIAVTVPLDDNVFPRHYAPLTAYLISRVQSDL
ncbi:putative phosphatase [Sphaerisporangium melleum]|uniref:Phosphatase n=1 Tax=Sphaerisporangium melleum TaxID=321316 RepID=A0A917RAU1_9ACTN|nr:phosphatase [Sphaerisporangium melleum]GGK99220.1 putative phosphatase [Sphaerisporangium melleum]GII73570.1 putative phosphatase [Sphaerisporangium melleum]